MVKLTFAILTILLTHLSARAQNLPWPEGSGCARVVALNSKGTLVTTQYEYKYLSMRWANEIAELAKLHRTPNLKVSYELILLYDKEASVIKNAEYAANCQSLPELDEETQRLMELQETRKLRSEDFKHPQWLHTVVAIDRQEKRCITFKNYGNNKITGCGDVWQGGITADEVVCFEGKNHLKCHVDCISKLNNVKPNVTPGFCQ